MCSILRQGSSSLRTLLMLTYFGLDCLTPVASVTSTSHRVVNAAVQHADRIFRSGVWSRAPAQQRSRALTKLARSLEEQMPRFAQMESMQTGRAIREMNAQLGRLPEWMYAFVATSFEVLLISSSDCHSDYYAALLRTHQGIVAPTQGQLLNYVRRVPLGVVAQITVSSISKPASRLNRLTR